MHPRLPRLATWMAAALAVLGLVQMYRSRAAWDRLRENAAMMIRPATSAGQAPEVPATAPAPALAAASPVPDEPARTLPDAFQTTSDYQRHCARFYGTEYLETLAHNRAEYCEGGSASLVCFYAASLRSAGQDGDPVCVARGAHINATGAIHMDCQLRNFTAERQQSDAARTALQPFKDVADIPSYYFDTGAGIQLRSWSFGEGGDVVDGAVAAADAAEDPCDADGPWYILARREGNTNLWHKLMEIWQATLTVQALWLATDPTTGAPLMTAAQRDSLEVVLEDDREEYLDPIWTMVTGRPPLRRSRLPKPLCPGRLILPLAGSSSSFWPAIVDVHDRETCDERALLRFLLPRTLAAMGIKSPRRATDVHFYPVVTIVHRQKTRVFQDLDAHVATLRQRNPNVTFDVVDMAVLTLTEQVQRVQGSDVLVGHHGAGMTHVLFLPPGAAVVEIFPAPRFPIVGFRQIALMHELVHFVGHSVWKEEWDAAVHGVPVPADWERPLYDEKWQSAPASYVLEADFIRLVEAAIQSQTYKSSNIWE